MQRIPQNSFLARAYYAWFERTGEPVPKEGVLTSCFIRLIAIYQLLYVFRTTKVPGAKYVRWWMVVSVVMFALLAAIFPNVMRDILFYVPFLIVVSLIGVVVFWSLGYLLGYFLAWLVHTLRLERVFQALGDAIVDGHEWLWSVRIKGFPLLAVVVITSLLVVLQLTSLYIFKLYPAKSLMSLIGFGIFSSMLFAQLLTVVIGGLVVLSALNDEYDFSYQWDSLRMNVGLVSPVELAKRAPEKKVHGIYKFIMDLGLCRYAKIE